MVDCTETLEDVTTDDFEEGSGDEASIWCERQKKANRDDLCQGNRSCVFS